MPGHKQKIFDISPVISPETAVWPGDLALSRQVSMDCHQGDHLTLSSIATTLHIGAHGDAPSHFSAQGKTIDQVSLEAYIGPCAVVTCLRGSGLLVRGEDLAGRVVPGCRRVLVRTLSYPDLRSFNRDFVAFHPSAIQYLGSLGVILVGIDTPSVDLFESKDLPSHHELARQGMLNLEGLDLRDVDDGEYELIALPLRLKGCDASPVRAILRSL